MHKRSLLIGVGIGIIIGALLLQLYNLGSDSQKQLNQISDEINNTTPGAGIPQPNITSSNGVENEKSGDRIEPSSSSNSELENDDQETDPEAQKPNSTAAPAVEEQTEADATSSSSEPSVEADEPAKRYIVRIHPGTSVNKTAKLLVNYNVIEDAASFTAHLKEHDKGIRAGFFLVEEGSTDEQIRMLLSGIPLSEKESKSIINDEKLTLIE